MLVALDHWNLPETITNFSCKSKKLTYTKVANILMDSSFDKEHQISIELIFSGKEAAKL